MPRDIGDGSDAIADATLLETFRAAIFPNAKLLAIPLDKHEHRVVAQKLIEFGGVHAD